MKVIGVIPARYGSTRLPGKPLLDICGKPMVQHVYDQALKSKLLTNVIIATESDKIQGICKLLGIPTTMTSDKCLNGSERVSEVAHDLEADVIVTIQGDEPLVEPENIDLVIQTLLSSKTADCATLKTKFSSPVDVVNATTPKVVCDIQGNILLLSRSPIPYPHSSISFDYYKGLGIYAFRPEIIKLYKNLEMTPIEKIEGIELLRLIENGYKIVTKTTQSKSISVDTIKDYHRVRKIIEERNAIDFK